MNQSHDLPRVDDPLALFTSEGPESDPEPLLSAGPSATVPSAIAFFAPEQPLSSVDPAGATAWSPAARRWEWRTPWLLAPVVAFAIAVVAVVSQFVPEVDRSPSGVQTAYAAPLPPGSAIDTVPADPTPDSGIVGTTEQSVVGTTQKGDVGATQQDIVGTTQREIVVTTQPSEARGLARPRETGPAWLPPVSPPAVRRPDPLPPPSQPSPRPDAPAVTALPAVTAVPDVPPAPVEAGPPPAAVAAESPREAPPLPAPAPARAATAPGIRVALDEYEHAVGRLDTSAVRAVWPSADVKGLAKAFDQLREQSLKLEDCRIAPTGSTAVATCAGTLRYVPKMGNKTERVERRQWEFSLREKNESWVIERVASR